MKPTKKKIHAFQTMIFSWWRDNRRDLPWRHTHDPYNILVSEVMLQQTQVQRALPKYAEFIETYPTVYDLAKASVADVLRIWKGMGYNRRALYLQQTAKQVVLSGFPSNEQELKKLPGIGQYTARAILVFAYNQDVSMVDTNIRQIIIHFFFKDTLQSEKIINKVASMLVPKGKSWEWHQALMDYGALALTSKSAIKKQKPFKNSNRFYRGRIIDLLRGGEIEEKKLFLIFKKKPSNDINTIINGLIKDKLVVKIKNVLSLPS